MRLVRPLAKNVLISRGNSPVWNFCIVYLGHHFTGEPLVVWQNFVCYVTLALHLNFFHEGSSLYYYVHMWLQALQSTTF